MKLLEAMAAVGCTWKWYRFVAIILLSYFGCCRTGEVLRAQRRHVVLPSDLAMDIPSGAIFLRIVEPKAKRRGLGKVQHAKIEDSLVCRFLSRYLAELNLDEQIFSGAPSSFRRRWDAVLKALDVPASLEITPGGASDLGAQSNFTGVGNPSKTFYGLSGSRAWRLCSIIYRKSLPKLLWLIFPLQLRQVFKVHLLCIASSLNRQSLERASALRATPLLAQ